VHVEWSQFSQSVGFLQGGSGAASQLILITPSFMEHSESATTLNGDLRVLFRFLEPQEYESSVSM